MSKQLNKIFIFIFSIFFVFQTSTQAQSYCPYYRNNPVALIQANTSDLKWVYRLGNIYGAYPFSYCSDLNINYYYYYRKKLLLDSSTLAPYLNDKASVINETIIGAGPVTEYQFKVGEDSNTNCTVATGYSEWLPTTQKLNTNIFDLENGKVRLCLVGRGLNNGQQVTQPYTRATVYRWSIALPPGPWSLIGPKGLSSSTTPIAIWSKSKHATNYRIWLANNSACRYGTRSWFFPAATSGSISVTNNGVYYLCGVSYDDLGNSMRASNSGMRFEINSNLTSGTIRDSLGINTSLTERNISIGNHVNTNTPNWYQTALIKVTPSTRIKLSQWQSQIEGSYPSPSGYLCQPDISKFTFQLHVWSSEDLAKANPLLGDVKNFDIPRDLITGPTHLNSLALTGCNINSIAFDLLNADAILEANSTYYLAISFHSKGSPNGVWGWLESSEEGETDKVIYNVSTGEDPLKISLATELKDSTTGRIAVKLEGLLLP
jgi:hypothetical protein